MKKPIPNQLSPHTQQLFEQLTPPFAGDYTLYFTDPDDDNDSTVFHLTTANTPVDLLAFWVSFTADNDFDINCLDQIVKGPVNWD